jgi:hypothetical protein
MGHAVALELPRARRRELEPRGMWWPRRCPGPGDRSWSHGAHGGPGAALGLVAGAGATGHVAAPELP